MKSKKSMDKNFKKAKSQIRFDKISMGMRAVGWTYYHGKIPSEKDLEKFLDELYTKFKKYNHDNLSSGGFKISKLDKNMVKIEFVFEESYIELFED